MRSRSVPPRERKPLQFWKYLTCSGEDLFEGVDYDINPRSPVKPRSVSHNSLDRLSRRLEWKDLVTSGCVEKTENNADGLGLPPTIKRSCVKSESPTVVHQSESASSITAMSAEFVASAETVEESPIHNRDDQHEGQVGLRLRVCEA